MITNAKVIKDNAILIQIEMQCFKRLLDESDCTADPDKMNNYIDRILEAADRIERHAEDV